MKATWSVRGLNELRRVFQQAPDYGERILLQVVREIAEEVMTESKEQCPVDTGALRGSGRVESVTFQGSAVTAVLAYGDAAVGYAIYVHEDMEARHPVGKAKFLEDPLLEAAANITRRLNDKLVEIFFNAT